MSDYVGGLDLGQASDYTALAILTRTEVQDKSHYTVAHLERWPLGTSYPDIIAGLAKLLARNPQGKREPPLHGLPLAVDRTGVGRAVVNIIEAADLPAELHPVTITAGHNVTADGGGLCVPKKELVSVLQVLLQSRRLKIAQVPEAETLAKELQNFRVKITTAGNETFENWRERDHDDLVLAVALAAWLGERSPRASAEEPYHLPRSILGRRQQWPAMP